MAIPTIQHTHDAAWSERKSYAHEMRRNGRWKWSQGKECINDRYVILITNLPKSLDSSFAALLCHKMEKMFEFVSLNRKLKNTTDKLNSNRMKNRSLALFSCPFLSHTSVIIRWSFEWGKMPGIWKTSYINTYSMVVRVCFLWRGHVCSWTSWRLCTEKGKKFVCSVFLWIYMKICHGPSESKAKNRHGEEVSDTNGNESDRK